MTALKRLLVLGAAALLGLALARAMLELPPPPVRLAAQVQSRLGASGVTHPVTAVLLNFRGYDTLLEIAVLLQALLGVLAAGAGAVSAGPDPYRATPAVLQAMARLLGPSMVLVAVYLVWAGAHRPGGAFQAAAVLAAGLVLLRLAGLTPPWPAPGRQMRAGLAAGFLLFLALAAMLAGRGALLAYPPQWAGQLIFAIEAGLAISLALVLAGLFLWLPNEHQRDLE